MESIYKVKDPTYYRGVREDLISILPNNPSQKILEIGAGGGNTLVEIKSRGLALEVFGSDIFSLENSYQKHPSINKFIITDIEQNNLDLPENYFDTIICGDVLEHLVDPWKVVEKLTLYLKKDGVLIISVPNIREISTLSKIFFFGDFRYNPEGGILDKTHLRFFCKKNAMNLGNTDKLKTISYHSSIDLKNDFAMVRRRIINIITLGLFKEFLTIQHIIIAKK